jgi:hypothetical protein
VNNMNDRITEVSSEAEQTERHAVSVHENAAALEAAVANLRHAIIRVVRTSTAEVDRRDTPRYQVDLPCRLHVGDAVHAASLADLSVSGAHVRDAPPLAAGVRGVVALEGVAARVPFVIRNVDDRGGLHVAFEKDADVRAHVTALLDRLHAPLAA